MPKVTFIVDGEPRTVEFEPATLEYPHHGRPGSILDVALNFAVPLEHACGGNCACTTCHVIIRAGSGNLSEMDDDEADRLDTAWDLTPTSRLGCQAVVSGDVTCEVPAYTRNYVRKPATFSSGRASPGTREEKRP